MIFPFFAHGTQFSYSALGGLSRDVIEMISLYTEREKENFSENGMVD
jgi:hypothetical protein